MRERFIENRGIPSYFW